MSIFKTKASIFYALLILVLMGGFSSQAHAQVITIPDCDYDQSNMTTFFNLDVVPMDSDNPDECCFQVFLVNTSDCNIWYHGSTRITSIPGEENGGIVRNIKEDKSPEIQAILGPGASILLPYWPICVDKDDLPVTISFQIRLQDPQTPSIIYEETVDVVIEDCESNCCPDFVVWGGAFNSNVPGCCGVYLNITPQTSGCRYNAISIIQDGFGSEYATATPPPPIMNHPVLICNGDETIIDIEFAYYNGNERIVRCVRQVRVTCLGVVEVLNGTSGGGGNPGGGSQKLTRPEVDFAGQLKMAPNPAQNMTTITYTMSAEGHMNLELFNAFGQRVERLDEGIRSKGSHDLQYVTNHLAAGVYYVRLTQNGNIVTMPITITR